MLRLLTLRWLAGIAGCLAALGIGALERGCADDGVRAGWGIALLALMFAGMAAQGTAVRTRR